MKISFLGIGDAGLLVECLPRRHETQMSPAPKSEVDGHHWIHRLHCEPEVSFVQKDPVSKDDSAAKGTCHQANDVNLTSPNSLGGKRKPAPTSCPLAFT